MKFIITALLIGSQCLMAQNNPEVFTLKPALGISGCQIHGDSFSGYDKFGVFGGVGINARLSEKISVELGFYFSQKGARHNQNPDKGDFSFYRVNLNYIDLPVLFRYHVNPTYFITGGPSIAYLIDYSEENQLSVITGMYKFNKYEVGVNVGLGRKIKESFFVEVRSSNSITPIRDYGILATQIYYPNAVARFFNKGLYNNIITLIVSYKINFKKK